MSFDIGEGFDWDKIKEDLQKAIKLEKDEASKTVKLLILEENVEENQMVGGMLKGEEEMKK